jgi:hypothetical protein
MTGWIKVIHRRPPENPKRRKEMKKMKLNWKAKRHNGQCAHGEWIARDQVLPSHREWIDTSILEGEAKDGDVIRVEGGTWYLIKTK